MIAAREVVKSFRERKVLCGLNCEAKPGAVTLLVGANGAGKSTFLRIVAGLSLPDGGTVNVAGHDVVRERRGAATALSFLPQAPRFHPRLTARQVACFYGRIRGIRDAETLTELERWGLESHLDTVTAELSGGLRQRLAIAIFALPRAPVLVLDEPGLSLDPEWRARLQAYLHDVAAGGTTVLAATHLLGEWNGKADVCLVLEAGRMAGELPPDRLQDGFPLTERLAAS
jgi:ABC-type multidrug transport system ATPase subunit